MEIGGAKRVPERSVAPVGWGGPAVEFEHANVVQRPHRPEAGGKRLLSRSDITDHSKLVLPMQGTHGLGTGACLVYAPCRKTVRVETGLHEIAHVVVAINQEDARGRVCFVCSRQ